MPSRARNAAIEAAVARSPRLDPNRSALIGLSGGRDSVVLLHAMVQAGFKDLIVCHFDHGLREDSEEDAWFAAELAEKYGFPFEADRVPVAEIAAEEKLSIEAAARRARYEFFAQVAGAHWCPRVVLAHHADDQAETLLLNLFRGSGRAGLSGMQNLSVREVRGARLEIHRPLLGFSREDLAGYATTHRLRFREDPSNTDRRFTRNRLRHEVIPKLEESFGREVKLSLARTAEILAAEETYLETQTPRFPAGPVKASEIAALPIAIQRRAIYRWLCENQIRDVGFDDVENVRGLLTNVSPARVNLAGGRHARRKSGQLFIE